MSEPRHNISHIQHYVSHLFWALLTITVIGAAVMLWVYDPSLPIARVDSGWQTYSNHKFGYSLQVPAGWIILSNSHGSPVSLQSDDAKDFNNFIIAPPNGSAHDGLMVGVDEHPGMPLNEYFSWKTGKYSYDDSHFTTASHADVRYVVAPDAATYLTTERNRYNFYTGRDQRIVYLGFTTLTSTVIRIVGSFTFIDTFDGRYYYTDWTLSPTREVFRLRRSEDGGMPCNKPTNSTCDLIVERNGTKEVLVDLSSYITPNSIGPQFFATIRHALDNKTVVIDYDAFNKDSNYHAILAYNTEMQSWNEIVASMYIMEIYKGVMQTMHTTVRRGDREVIFVGNAGDGKTFSTRGVYFRSSNGMQKVDNPLGDGGYSVALDDSSANYSSSRVKLLVDGGSVTFNFDTGQFEP